MLETTPDERSSKRRLSELRELYPIPDGGELDDAFLEQIEVAGLPLYMVGLVAPAVPGARAVVATGSAAELGGYPIDRAYFELLERVCTLGAKDRDGSFTVRDLAGSGIRKRRAASVFGTSQAADERSRPSYSNGVALHLTWREACRAARHELLERDRVLRSFRGDFAPTPKPSAAGPVAAALDEHYRAHGCVFAPPTGDGGGQVAGLFLFPRSSEAPMVYGFGAGESEEAATQGATREALQRLAFLWGEQLPSEPPAPAPTPDYHQEYYLYPPHHAVLRAWLSGERVRGRKTSPAFDPDEVVYTDLTPDALAGRLSVVQASAKHAVRLRFGSNQALDKHHPHPVA